MAAKKEESIQFEDSDLAELQKVLSQQPSETTTTGEKVVRHSFRVPFAKEDAVFVEIAGKSYPVANISDRGLGIRLPKESEFSSGQELQEIVFNFGGRPTVLKGRVVHVSMEEENAFLCGISLMEMSEEQEKMLSELVQQQRLAMFSRE